MTYRDENEALRARVDSLVTENRELREAEAGEKEEQGQRTEEVADLTTRFRAYEGWRWWWEYITEFHNGALTAVGVGLSLVVISGMLIWSLHRRSLEPSPIVVRGEIRGDGWSFVPSSCTSGERERFFGAEITSTDARDVRLVQDPVSGSWTVSVLTSGAAPIVLRGACVSANLETTNIIENDIHFVNGTIHVDCASSPGVNGDAGGRIVGDVQFWGCH